MGKGQRNRMTRVGQAPNPAVTQMININEAVPLKCAWCDDEFFLEAFRLGTVSRLAASNKTGVDVRIKIETFRCMKCGQEAGTAPKPDAPDG